MTREGRKTLFNKYTCDGVAPPYLSMLCANVELSGEIFEDTHPFYVVEKLATNGELCYIKSVNSWAEFKRSGKNTRTGFPSHIRLKGNGGEYSAAVKCGEDTDYLIFPANATFTPLVDAINYRVALLQEIDLNILQNLDTLRQMALVKASSAELAAKLAAIDNKRRRGDSAAVLEVGAGDEVDVVNLSPNSENHLPAYLQMKEAVKEELAQVVGVAKMAEKGERRVNGEIDLAVDAASACIDLLIQAINEYCKFYGLNGKAQRKRGAFGDLYDEQQDAAENAENEDETGE